MGKYLKEIAAGLILLSIIIFGAGLIIAYRGMKPPAAEEIKTLAAPAKITEPAPMPKSDKPVCLHWDTLNSKMGHLKVCKQWAE